jgi:hypothetical protein
MSTANKILSVGKQGPAGAQGPAGSPANVTAANVLTAAQAMDATQEAGMRQAIGAQSRAVGFYDRFDRSDRYAEGATITANTTTPETGGWAYRVAQTGATAPTVTAGALECSSDTLYYLSNRVATPDGRFSLGLVIEMERTSVFATAVNNGGFNVTIGASQLVDDAGSIVAGLATNPIHVNFTINGIADAELYASGGSTALTCLNATKTGGVFPWNSDGSYLPVGAKIALLFEVEGDILRITAAGLGYLEFTHPDISTKVGSAFTYFWFEPNGPLLGTDYKHIARLYRWWAMAEELNQLASHGTLPGIGGPRRIDGQLRLFPEGRTSRLATDTLPGINTAALVASANGTVAKGTHNRVTGGEAIFEGPVIHNFGYTATGGSIAGFMVGSIDSNLNTPTSSSAGVETNISGGGFIPTWGLENGDWESWFFAGQLVGTNAKRIRLFAEYAGGGVPGNIIDSDAAGTPLTAVTGFWTLEVKRYTTSTASHVFYAELKANGVLIAAKRTTANHTTNYYTGNIKTTTVSAGAVTLDTYIQQIARVNVT